MNPYDVIRRPVITEKATILKEEAQTLCFQVHRDASGIEIQRAVETIFNVKVADVRVLRVRGKPRRLGRYQGVTAEWKKAYVRLAKGQPMVEYFDGV